ncbi:MAG: ribosome maturation factor RimM [Chloroflexota bacterium]
MTSKPSYLLLGEILRPHGVRGELRMRIFTDYPERLIKDVKTVYLGQDVTDEDTIPYTVKSARFHKDYLLLTFSEIKDRNQADTLRGLKVMVDIDNAVPLEDGEYYLYQLIGLTVKTTDDVELGQIQDFIETGANDVYVVKGRAYGELLLPAHDETIIDIDFDNQVIVMQLPEGLLPEDA